MFICKITLKLQMSWIIRIVKSRPFLRTPKMGLDSVEFSFPRPFFLVFFVYVLLYVEQLSPSFFVPLLVVFSRLCRVYLSLSLSLSLASTRPKRECLRVCGVPLENRKCPLPQTTRKYACGHAFPSLWIALCLFTSLSHPKKGCVCVTVLYRNTLAPKTQSPIRTIGPRSSIST